MKKAAFTLALVLLISFASFSQTNNWTGNISTDWSTAGNWSNGVPAASADVVIGTTSRNPVIDNTSNCNSVTLSGTATLTLNKPLTVAGNITISTGAGLIHNGTTLVLYGNFTNNGTYTGNLLSKITFAGINQTISGTTLAFKKVVINTGSYTTLKANISVSDSLIVNGTVDPSDNTTYSVTGTANVVLGPTGVAKVTAAAITSNYSISGIIIIKPGSTIEYSSLVRNQIIYPTITYSTLKISGTGIKTLGGNLLPLSSTLASDGNVYVSSGTLDLATFTCNRGTVTAGGTFNVSNGAALKIGGLTTNFFPANFATTNLSLTSTVEYYGGGTQLVSAQTYGNLTLSSNSVAATKTMPLTNFTVAGNITSTIGTGTGVTFTAASNITVSGIVTIGAGTTFNGGSYAHTVGGNWINNGTFTGSTSTINLNGPGSVMSGSGVQSFNNLSVNASNITATSSAITISGNLATTTAGTFTLAAGSTVTMSGSGKTITGTGITVANLTVPGSVTTTSVLTITGNLSVSGSFTASNGSVTMNGAGKTIVGAGTVGFYALLIPGTVTTATSFSVSNALDVSGSFSASAGTVTFTNTATLNGTANLYNTTINGTSLILSTNAVLGIANAFTITAGTLNVTTAIPNTVTFNGSVAQIIPAATYHRLILTNAGTKTAGGAINVNGIFSIDAGVTFNASSFTHTLNSSLVNSGTLTAGTSTVVFAGATDATITGATTFNLLVINKTSSTNGLTLLSNISVPTVNMTSGWIKTGANTLTITTTRTGNGIILGNIKRSHTFTTGVAYAFESPDNTITFTSVSAVTSITVAASQTNITDFPFGTAVNRLYDISVPAGTYNATLRLHYEDAELNGNTETWMFLYNYAAAWVASGKTANSTAANYVEQSGLTNITNRWAIAYTPSVLRWNGSVSSAWNTAANWTVIQGSPGTVPTANDVAQIGHAAFTNQPIISSAVSVKNIEFGSASAAILTVASGGSLTVLGNVTGTWSANAMHTINAGAQNITVNGNLSLSDGTAGHAINLNATSGIITIGGTLTQSGGANVTITGTAELHVGTDFNYSGGTFAAGSGTVYYEGSGSQTIASIPYNNLTINKSAGTATISGTTTIAGTVNLNNGELYVSGNTSVTGSLNINAAAKIRLYTINLNLSGDLNNSGTFIPGSSTISFIGAATQMISLATFNNIIINKPSGNITFTGNINIYGDFSILAGNIDLGNYTANRASLGGTFSLAPGTTFSVAASNNFPSNYSSYLLNNASTVIYNGSAAQTINGITYGNLVATNGGTNVKTLGASVIVNGDITINSGATIDGSAYTITLAGNWINNGTFVPSSGTVMLNGTGKTINGNTTFNKVSVYGSYAVAGADITYNGTLYITATGSFDGGSGTATLNGNLTNSGSLISNGVTNFSGTTVQTIRFLNAIISNSTGVINFNGTVPPVLNSTSTPAFATLNVNNTGGINPSVDWTVYVAMNISSGATFNAGTTTLNLYGGFTNSGTFTSSGIVNFMPTSATNYKLAGTGFSSSGTVNFAGTGAIATLGTPNSLNNVTVANTTGVTPGTGWNMAGDFNIINNGVFNASANSYIVAGDIQSSGTLNGGTSTFTMTSAGTAAILGNSVTTFYNFIVGDSVTVISDFNVAHNFTNNKYVDASVGTVTLTGSVPSIIGGTASPYTLATFAIKKDATATATLAQNVSGIAEVKVYSGTLDLSGYTLTQQSGATNLLSVADSATLRIGGTNGLPTFSTYALDTLSTVEFAGSTQAISSVTAYGNLVISAAGTKTASGALNILNNFSLSNGTFVGGAYNHLIRGNWSMTSGGFTNTGTTISFNGTTTQSISSTGAFNNVIINKNSGATKILSDITVNSTLAFTKGSIQTNSYKVIIPLAGSISGAAQTTGWVNGNLQKSFTAGGSIVRAFELGDSSSYTPVSVTIGTVSTAGNLIAGVKATDHPGISASAISSSRSVNRYWTFTNSGIVFSNAAVAFNWVATDIDAGVVTSNLKVAQYTGAWSVTSFGNITATSIQATGLSSFSDFAIGESCTGGTWIGTVSSAWNLSSNWQCGSIPDNATNVIISSNLTNYPVIDALTTEINSLTLQTGASLSINNGTLKIKGTMATAGGTINADNGKVELTGTSSQTIPAGFFSSNVVKDIVVSNATGVSLAGAVKVTGSVRFGNVNNAALTTGGFLTLASSATTTAQLADITNGGVNTGNSISGNVTIERYLSAKRAFRFLTAPVNSTGSIRANWMENTNNSSTSINNNPFPGYGIHITGKGGAANGFDPTRTNNPSLFTFDDQTQLWVSPSNTSGNLIAGNAFRIFVRGSRSTDLSINNPVPTATILRATGTLVTGNVIFKKTFGTTGTPQLSTLTNGYSLIGNPYASSVDWLSLDKTDLSATVVVFDPTISGSNGRGAYVSYNSVIGVDNNSSSYVDNNIQSGQAFFVQTTGSNPSLTFKETDKTAAIRSVFRTNAVMPKLSVQLVLSQSDLNKTADGVVAYFSDAFDASVGKEDSYKFNNPDENIGILRDGAVLSIEGRKPVKGMDTLPLKIWQLQQKNYAFKISMTDFAQNVNAFLEDSYLHTLTPVSNISETFVPFSITVDSASFAQDRFRIIFENFTTLSVKLTNVKAYEKNKGVEVEWNAQSESNMDRYEVEHSSDAQQFQTMGNVNAKNNSDITIGYNLFDSKPNNGDNYYRIRSISRSGEVKYSEIIKVIIQNTSSNISVVTNAGIVNSFNVYFKNTAKGNYAVNVINNNGQRVYEGSVSHSGGSANYVVNLNRYLSSGIYHVQVVGADVIRNLPLLINK